MNEEEDLNVKLAWNRIYEVDMDTYEKLDLVSEIDYPNPDFVQFHSVERNSKGETVKVYFNIERCVTEFFRIGLDIKPGGGKEALEKEQLENKEKLWRYINTASDKIERARKGEDVEKNLSDALEYLKDVGFGSKLPLPASLIDKASTGSGDHMNEIDDACNAIISSLKNNGKIEAIMQKLDSAKNRIRKEIGDENGK